MGCDDESTTSSADDFVARTRVSPVPWLVMNDPKCPKSLIGIVLTCVNNTLIQMLSTSGIALGS